MSFPFDDRNWSEVANFLAPRARSNESVLAPDDFWRIFPQIYRYINTRLRPTATYDWAIIHKGQLAEFSLEFLRSFRKQMVPVFANEVFVVWARPPATSPLLESSIHVRPLLEAVRAAREGRAGEPTQNEHTPVLPDPGSIFQFESLGVREMREAMDAFWRNGGYRHETPRDQCYRSEVDAYVSDFLPDVAGGTILDLCCGAGRVPAALQQARKVVGVDLSEVAIGLAAATHRGNPALQFQVMDARALGLASETFDIVTFLEAIDYVHDATRVLSEIARVLKPGGKVLLTASNANSLHLVMRRRLGFPLVKENYQQIRGFSFDACRGLLAENGLRVVRSGGIFLYPYWEIPGVDRLVRPVTDSDPEVIELLRTLGRAAGPESAYAFVILAQKSA